MSKRMNMFCRRVLLLTRRTERGDGNAWSRRRVRITQMHDSESCKSLRPFAADV